MFSAKKCRRDNVRKCCKGLKANLIIAFIIYYYIFVKYISKKNDSYMLRNVHAV